MASFDPPDELLRRPATYLVWGRDRMPVELLAFGLADRIDPEFQWVADLCRTPAEREHPLGPVGELVPSDRRVVVGFLEEQFTVPEQLEHSIRTMIRSTPVDPSLVRLTTFAALPRALQVALARSSRGPRPGALILADPHHLNERWVDSILAEPLFHEFLKSQNASLLVTYLDEPSAAMRSRFDHVVRVETEPGEQWLRARVLVEPRDAQGTLAEGDTRAAMSLGPFGDALAAALARRSALTSAPAPETGAVASL